MELRKWLTWRRCVVFAVVVLIVLAAMTPQLLTPYNPAQIDPNAILQGPSLHHWLGTTQTGTDLYTLIVYGTRLDGEIVLGSLALAIAIGVPCGLLAGYGRRLIDEFLSSVFSGILAFPLMLLGLLIVGSFGASVLSLTVILGIAFMPQVFLLVKGEARVIAGRPFISAAQVTGLSHVGTLFRHVVPNLRSSLVVLLTQLAAIAVLAEAGLTYLGLGVQPPQETWGTILLESKNYYAQDPLYAAIGGLIVALAAASLLLAGNSIARRRRESGVVPDEESQVSMRVLVA